MGTKPSHAINKRNVHYVRASTTPIIVTRSARNRKPDSNKVKQDVQAAEVNIRLRIAVARNTKLPETSQRSKKPRQPESPMPECKRRNNWEQWKQTRKRRGREERSENEKSIQPEWECRQREKETRREETRREKTSKKSKRRIKPRLNMIRCSHGELTRAVKACTSTSIIDHRHIPAPVNSSLENWIPFRRMLFS